MKFSTITLFLDYKVEFFRIGASDPVYKSIAIASFREIDLQKHLTLGRQNGQLRILNTEFTSMS